MGECVECGFELPAGRKPKICPSCGAVSSDRALNVITMKEIEGHHYLSTVFPAIPKTYWRPGDNELKWFRGRNTASGSRHVGKTAGKVVSGPGITLDSGLYDVEFQITVGEPGRGPNIHFATVEVTAYGGEMPLEAMPVKSDDVQQMFDPDQDFSGVRLSLFLENFVEDVEFRIESKGEIPFEVHGIKLIPRFGRIWLPATQLAKLGEIGKDWEVGSSGRSITFLKPSEDFMLYGPYEHLKPGDYQVGFALVAPEGASSGDVAEIDIISAKTEEDPEDEPHKTIERTRIAAKDLGAFDYKLSFYSEMPLDDVEFRVKPLVDGLKVRWIRLATDSEAIWQHYFHLGGLSSELGSPRSGYWHAADSDFGGSGSLRRFEGGSIYWNRSVGQAFEVTGAIGVHWESLGGTTSPMGFPTSRKKGTKSSFGTNGLVQKFEQKRVVFSYTDDSGKEVAYEVYGAISWRYFEEGSGEGKFGFPVSGEEEWEWEGREYKRSMFEGGIITWDDDKEETGAYLYPIPAVDLSHKPGEARLNEPLTIRVYAENRGGEAKEAYFSVTFLNQVKIVDGSRKVLSGKIDHIQRLSEGKTWYGKYGQVGWKKPFRYPMVEAVAIPFEAEGFAAFEVVVIPLEEGNFRMQHKFSMRKPFDLGWVADPAIGSRHVKGQQDEHVFVRTLQVRRDRGLRGSHIFEFENEDMDQVFISYRRTDSYDSANLLCDELEAHFGSEKIFLDERSIGPGTTYPDVINRVLKQTAIMLVIIGENWLDEERFDNPSDLHRIEIEEALDKGIPVIPLLVDDADFPDKKSLPLRLRPLADRQ